MVSSRSCLGNNYRKLVQKEESFWVLGHLKELESKHCTVIRENMAFLNTLVSVTSLDCTAEPTPPSDNMWLCEFHI